MSELRKRAERIMRQLREKIKKRERADVIERELIKKVKIMGIIYELQLWVHSDMSVLGCPDILDSLDKFSPSCFKMKILTH